MSLTHAFRNFYFPVDEPNECDFYVIGCGHEKCDTNYYRERSECLFYALEYIISGRGYYQWEDKKVQVSEGMFFSYGITKHHRYWSAQDKPFEKVWIAFNGTNAAHLLEKAMGQVNAIASFDRAKDIHLLMAECVNESAYQDIYAQEIVNNYVRIILRKLHRTRKKALHETDATHERFVEWKRFIDEHYDRMRTPYEMLESHPISPSYLCRLFKKYCGRSPYEYMVNLKMNRSAHLLMTTSLSIKQIALEVNFEDPLHFSRLFRKQFGRSPRDYRQVV